MGRHPRPTGGIDGGEYYLSAEVQSAYSTALANRVYNKNVYLRKTELFGIEMFLHLTVCKQILMSNRIISDTQRYLKTLKCVQTND